MLKRGTTEEPYRVVVGEALVHDVVKVHQEITVGQHVLVPGHHLADELVGLQFSGLVFGGQLGGLQGGGIDSLKISN